MQLKILIDILEDLDEIEIILVHSVTISFAGNPGTQNLVWS